MRKVFLAAIISVISFTSFGKMTEQFIPRADEAVYGYLLYTPEKNEGDAIPLLIFLHGAGYRGRDTSLLYRRPIVSHVRKGHDLPCAMLVPQCPLEERWDPATLKRTIEDIKALIDIDEERVYLTGQSLGGYGTWDALAAYPDLFAAAAPLCGGGNPYEAWRYAHVPLRAYHGTEDNAVPIIESEKMVRALQVCNGNAELIRLVGQGHGIESVYHDSSFYSWIFSHRRKPGQKSDADSLCYRLYTGITLSADSLVAIRPGASAQSALTLYNSTPFSAHARLKILSPSGSAIAFAVDSVVAPPKAILPVAFTAEPPALGEYGISPFQIAVEMTYQIDAENRRVKRIDTLLAPQSFRWNALQNDPKIDGKSDDQRLAKSEFVTPVAVARDKETYNGAKDARFRFRVSKSDRYLYVTGEVFDDNVNAKAHVAPWLQDGIELRFDFRGDVKHCGNYEFIDDNTPGYVHRKIRERGNVCGDKDSIVLIAFSPVNRIGDSSNLFVNDALDGGIKSACVKIKHGYVFETAIALDAVAQQYGWKPGESFYFNIAVNDCDDEEKVAQLWWMPDWRENAFSVRSGLFAAP